MATAPTAPTAPPADGPALPIAPSTSRPETLDAEADAMFAALGPFQTEMQAVKTNAYANGIAAYQSALDAANSKASTAASEANIAAMANFKGTWASLAGALAKPASVFHSGAFWALLNNLVDVTTSQPGVTADWQVVGGSWPVQRINTNTVAQPWTTYVIFGACTLTAPAISGNGKQFEIVVLPGVTGAIFAPAGADKTRGVAGAQPIDAPFSAVLRDNGATDGWI